MAISIICADVDYTITTTTTEKNYLNGCAEWNGIEWKALKMKRRPLM